MRQSTVIRIIDYLINSEEMNITVGLNQTGIAHNLTNY